MTDAPDLYQDTAFYTVRRYGSREEWLKGREKTIGGSEAAAAINLSRWMTARDLWARKTGREDPPDLSDNPFVAYGTKKEPYLRQDFAMDFPEYDVQFQENAILYSKKHTFMAYSPDGLIYDRQTHKRGILEIKTHAIMRSDDWKAWRESIGIDEYFVQVLHGLIVTGFDFVELRAELKRSPSYKQIRTYRIDVQDEGIREQMEEILQQEEEFMKYVKADEEPPVIAYL